MSIDESNVDYCGYAKRAYFCQDKTDGSDADDKLGFKYSWVFNIKEDGSADEGVEIDVRTESLTKKTFMSEATTSVVEFAKSLLLSKEEKLLREAGLKDSCGEYTGAAKDIVLNKLVAENEAYLIDIAKKMAAEKKK